MAIVLNTNILRFFDNKDYADALSKNGEVFFNVISEFPNLQNDKFKDGNEGLHLFKNVTETSSNSGTESLIITHKWRKTSDAWAFCAATSSASNARKNYCVWIKNLVVFLGQIDLAIKEKFKEELLIIFGPVYYYSEDIEMFSKVQHNPFFIKSDKYKNDLEFRIVIIPSKTILDKGKIEPMKLLIPNPSFVLEETLFLETKNK